MTPPSRVANAPGTQNGQKSLKPNFLDGGYSLSDLTTFGSQVHHSFLLMESITLGTCIPHPNQVAFLQVPQVTRWHMVDWYGNWIFSGKIDNLDDVCWWFDGWTLNFNFGGDEELRCVGVFAAVGFCFFVPKIQISPSKILGIIQIPRRKFAVVDLCGYQRHFIVLEMNVRINLRI